MFGIKSPEVIIAGGANSINSKDDIRPWLDETLNAKNVVQKQGH